MSSRQIYRWSMRVLWVDVPLALATLAAWGFRLIPETRPTLLLMVYLLLVAVAAAAGVTAALATSHMAISKAFAAGYRTGTASVWPGDDETRQDRDALLRLVE